MEAIGADRKRIKAVIGPCIQQQSYEVGTEFRNKFVSFDASSKACFLPALPEEKYLFNLPKFINMRLDRMKVGGIGSLSLDTYQDEERFFSYRRAVHRRENDYGRQLSAILIS